MSIVFLDDGSGNLVNETICISGINVQIVNGLGATIGNPTNPITVAPALTVTNGLGNLIVGYNELRGSGDDRTGSHNIVFGKGNTYTSFGGLVGGEFNTITGSFASISAGRLNTASGNYSSVCGGNRNEASGLRSSVSGGSRRTVSGVTNWAAGSLFEND